MSKDTQNTENTEKLGPHEFEITIDPLPEEWEVDPQNWEIATCILKDYLKNDLHQEEREVVSLHQLELPEIAIPGLFDQGQVDRIVEDTRIVDVRPTHRQLDCESVAHAMLQS